MRILFTGDFAPILDIEQRLVNNNIEGVFGNILNIFQEHEEVVVNLECPLTNSNRQSKKTGPNLKASPYVAAALRNAGISVASLANNHVMDFGQAGLKDTIESLSANGIKVFGAGLNSAEAKIPLVLRNQNESIAIVAYAEHEYSIAAHDYPGANPVDPLRNALEIKQLLSNHDYVIVLVHGGHEYQRLPSPYYVDLMRFYASLGVNAVIGHHTHCKSFMELYDGVPICYGLGNFIFPWKETKNQAWYEGIFLSLSLHDGIVSAKTIPVTQDQSGKASYFVEAIDDIENNPCFVDQGFFESNDYLQQIGEYLRFKGKSVYLNLAIPNRFLRGIVKHGYFPEQRVIGDRFMRYYHSFHCEGSVEALRAYMKAEYAKHIL